MMDKSTTTLPMHAMLGVQIELRACSKEPVWNVVRPKNTKIEVYKGMRDGVATYDYIPGYWALVKITDKSRTYQMVYDD